MISIEQVKELRDATGVSIMQCRKALEEAGGDKEKALVILKKQSGAAALKKADRTVAAGLLVAKKVGTKTVAVTVNCETDFVAKNADFITLANAILDAALEGGKEKAEAVAAEKIPEAIQKIGENIKLGAITEKISDGVVGMYIHDGKLGTIVELSGGDEALAKDIAMQITAMKPEYITLEEITSDAIAKAKEVFVAEIDPSKPADMREKILQGKIDSYFKERVLLEQEFFKDPTKKMKDLLSSSSASIRSVEKLDIF